MDDTPKGLLRELTQNVWNRRILLIALAVLMAQSGLRLINAVVAYLIVPFLSGVLRQSDSVLFRSPSRYVWDALAFAVLEFSFVVMVVVFTSRALRPKYLGSQPENKLEVEGSEDAPVGENPDYYTITGDPASPMEQESEQKV